MDAPRPSSPRARSPLFALGVTALAWLGLSTTARAAPGECCEASQQGCSDPQIEACVCAGDAYCCDQWWDSLCAQEVESFGCGECEASCCASQAGPGCDDPQVEACVCDADPYCCTTRWDSICVDEVESLSCGSCSACASPNEEALIVESFETCPGTTNVGQIAPAGGVTCEQVCCAMGFDGCEYRGPQADYDTCEYDVPPQTGSCSDVFGPTWSSQCVCSGQAACGGDPGLIASSFEVCGASSVVGQSAPAGGVTCDEVCCNMGFSSCVGRGSQAGYDACNPSSPAMTGSCSDVFGSTWSSQCICE